MMKAKRMKEVERKEGRKEEINQTSLHTIVPIEI